MTLSLRSKVMLYFLLASLTGIIITSTAILWGFESQFDRYISQRREGSVAVVKEAIASSYMESGALINQEVSQLIHQQMMTDDLYYDIYNAENELVQMPMMHGGSSVMRRNNRQNSEKPLNQFTLPIQVHDETVGLIVVSYPDEMIAADIAFMETVQTNIYIALAIVVVMTLAISYFFSKQLTKGFQELSTAITSLRVKKFLTRIDVDSLHNEMKPLALSYNELADSLAKEALLRKEFTRDFAHEMKTPLATLRSQLEAYIDDIFEPTPERLNQSHAELMRLVHLVNELEELLSAENPQLVLNMEHLNLNTFLIQMTNQYKRAFETKNVDLTLTDTDHDFIVLGDSMRMVQIFTNLINNALNYTPSGKKVTVSLIETPEAGGFMIKDEGVGIKDADLPHLFERFYRGDKSRARNSGGMGIGLSIVKALVEAHQGEIEIKSEWGIGTEVYVWFKKPKER